MPFLLGNTMPTIDKESRHPSGPSELGNQNVTRPAPVDKNGTDDEIKSDQERPGLENNNVTAPGAPKPSQT
jgi:hypothetical protein